LPCPRRARAGGGRAPQRGQPHAGDRVVIGPAGARVAGEGDDEHQREDHRDEHRPGAGRHAANEEAPIAHGHPPLSEPTTSSIRAGPTSLWATPTLGLTRVRSELSASTVTIRAAAIPPPAGTFHSIRRASCAPS